MSQSALNPHQFGTKTKQPTTSSNGRSTSPQRINGTSSSEPDTTPTTTRS